MILLVRFAQIPDFVCEEMLWSFLNEIRLFVYVLGSCKIISLRKNNDNVNDKDEFPFRMECTQITQKTRKLSAIIYNNNN